MNGSWNYFWDIFIFKRLTIKDFRFFFFSIFGNMADRIRRHGRRNGGSCFLILCCKGLQLLCPKLFLNFLKFIFSGELTTCEKKINLFYLMQIWVRKNSFFNLSTIGIRDGDRICLTRSITQYLTKRDIRIINLIYFSASNNINKDV